MYLRNMIRIPKVCVMPKYLVSRPRFPTKSLHKLAKELLKICDSVLGEVVPNETSVHKTLSDKCFSIALTEFKRRTSETINLLKAEITR